MLDFFDKNIKSMVPVKPDGAFYLFVDISKVFGNLKNSNGDIINSSAEFCGYLLDKYLVAAVPGVEFGNDNFIRLSFATGLDVIKEGLNRIKESVGSL